MFGFLYDVLIVLFTAAMGYYFLHASKASPENRKLRFWGFASFVLGAGFLLMSLIRNVFNSSPQQTFESRPFVQSQSKTDSVKTMLDTVGIKSKKSLTLKSESAKDVGERDVSRSQLPYPVVKIDWGDSLLFAIKNVGQTPAMDLFGSVYIRYKRMDESYLPRDDFEIPVLVLGYSESWNISRRIPDELKRARKNYTFTIIIEYTFYFDNIWGKRDTVSRTEICTLSGVASGPQFHRQHQAPAEVSR
jgi:hypothetical protein